MNPKLALVLLLAIVVLFAVVLFLGMSRGDSATGMPHWMERAGNTLSRQRPLGHDDLGPGSPAACRSQFVLGLGTLEPGSSCIVVINQMSSFLPVVRVLTLELASEEPVQVEVRQEGQLTVKETLSEDSSIAEFNIYEAGGAVEMRCAEPGDDPCQFRVLW